MSVIVHIKTDYLDDKARILKGRYADGSTALVLQDPETGEMLAKATVCMVDYNVIPRDNQHVFIKNYSENAGMLKALQDAGVIGEALVDHDAGWAADGVHECQVLNLEDIDDYER